LLIGIQVPSRESEDIMYASTTAIPDAIRRQLGVGEQVLLHGQPIEGVRLRPRDVFFIPFSLLWCGFVVFWNVTVWSQHSPLFFRLWGVPFLLVGAYMVIGRFFVDAWMRARTDYAVTNERILIVTHLFSERVTSLSLASLPEMTLQVNASGRGTIQFGTATPVAATWNPSGTFDAQQRMPPNFFEIPDARAVADLVRQLQERRRA
jgi:hypothetical protein